MHTTFLHPLLGLVGGLLLAWLAHAQGLPAPFAAIGLATIPPPLLLAGMTLLASWPGIFTPEAGWERRWTPGLSLMGGLLGLLSGWAWARSYPWPWGAPLLWVGLSALLAGGLGAAGGGLLLGPALLRAAGPSLDAAAHSLPLGALLLAGAAALARSDAPALALPPLLLVTSQIAHILGDLPDGVCPLIPLSRLRVAAPAGLAGAARVGIGLIALGGGLWLALALGGATGGV